MLILLAALLAQDPPPRDLADLSLEELMRLEVTTASRKEQRLMDTPAAVSVIRGEDIRRSGVRSIPEALRLAPGTYVARIDGNKWAIGVRGFSDRFSNKLQVLIDGRSVYSPSFSGVFWEQQGAFLEDVDRIEVIRGPGGAVWGANAVNGVINVITKKARDTQGGLFYAGAGTEERAFGGLRYGGAAGDDVHYRAYVMGDERDEQRYPGGAPADDDMWQGRAGFRAEWASSAADVVTVMGEAFAGKTGSFTNTAAPPPAYTDPREDDYDLNGGHLLVRWERRLDGEGLLSTQLAYTRSVFDPEFVTERRDTLDVDATHRFRPFEGHDLVWGVGYRLTSDEIDGEFAVRFDPRRETDDVVSLFAQDEIALAGEALKLTLGTRFEHNDYTGLEVQPSARIGFRAHERHFVWAAASRAVRTPNRVEADIDFIAAVIPGPPDTEVHLVGDHELRSEELVSYEAGWRMRAADELTFDLALFFNDYEHLASAEPVPSPPNTVVSRFDRLYEGWAYGGELTGTWQALPGWRLTASYSALMLNLDRRGGSADLAREEDENDDAKGQVHVRSSLDLGEAATFDVLARYVGPLRGRDVDAYTELDARLAWRALPALELSIVGQNLLHDEHRESGDTGLMERATEIERGFYLMGVWTF